MLGILLCSLLFFRLRNFVFARFVMGIKVSVKKDETEYNKVLEQAQKDNERLGYGNRNEEWNKKEYNVTLTKLRRKKKEQEIKQKSFENIRKLK